MRILNILKVTTVAFGVTLSPTLFAASYTWNFYTGGSGNGSGMTFNSNEAGGPTVKATAWYLGLLSNDFTAGTIKQFSHGLGVCNGLENCSSNPNHQVDNDGLQEFVLFEFSTPVDPTMVTVTTTTSGGGDTDVSYWLGGDSAPLNLSGKDLGDLASLFSPTQYTSDAAPLGEGASRSISIPPDGTFVSKMLFGPRVGNEDNDYFKITSMAGNTRTTIVATPEPSSVILLGTIGLAALHLARKRARRA